MKPPDFDYIRPGDVDEAVSSLSAAGAEARVLAGGQSLIPMLNMRLSRPDAIVDLNYVADFPGLTVGEEGIEIGALVRQHEAHVSDELARECPLVGQAIAHVAHRAVRSRGTVVGSIVHADPAAELPAVLRLLEGSVIAIGEGGKRSIAAEDMFAGYFETALGSGEIAVSIRLRRMEPDEGSAFVEVARRSGDFAICGVAATVSDSVARVSVIGADRIPRVFDVSGMLDGDRDRVVHELTSDLEPLADVHASEAYRRHLAGELVRRAVSAAEENRKARSQA